MLWKGLLQSLKANPQCSEKKSLVENGWKIQSAAVIPSQSVCSFHFPPHQKKRCSCDICVRGGGARRCQERTDTPLHIASRLPLRCFSRNPAALPPASGLTFNFLPGPGLGARAAPCGPLYPSVRLTPGCTLPAWLTLDPQGSAGIKEPGQPLGNPAPLSQPALPFTSPPLPQSPLPPTSPTEQTA